MITVRRMMEKKHKEKSLCVKAELARVKKIEAEVNCERFNVYTTN